MKILNAMTKEEFLAVKSKTICHIADFQILKPIEVLFHKTAIGDGLWTVTTTNNSYVHLRENEGYEFAAFKKRELYDLIQSRNYFLMSHPITEEEMESL